MMNTKRTLPQTQKVPTRSVHMHPHTFKPGAAQPKQAVALPARKPPVAPPVYRPQQSAKSVQPKTALNSPAVPARISLARPAIPPAGRQQKTPVAVQGKMAGAPQQSSIIQPARTPVAPPVYRPQPTPRVLQTKMRNDQPGVKPTATGARAFQHNPTNHPARPGSKPPGSPGIKPPGRAAQRLAQPRPVKNSQSEIIVGKPQLSPDSLRSFIVQAKMPQHTPYVGVIQCFPGWKSAYVWFVRAQTLIASILYICTMAGAGMTVVGALTLASAAMAVGRIIWQNVDDETTQENLSKIEKIISQASAHVPTAIGGIVLISGGQSAAEIVSGILGLLVTFVGHIFTAGSVDNYLNLEYNLRQKIGGWVTCKNPEQDWSGALNPCQTDVHQVI